jgi:hypothetical protein
VNWGEMEPIQEEEDHHPGGGGMSMEDWVISKRIEDEQRRRDWLCMETLQPERRLKQMKLDIPIVVKKTGNELNIQNNIKRVDPRGKKKISKKRRRENKENQHDHL